ncbi:ferritin-like metal-binding protein YciE [Rhizobium sp. BK512]|nr:ferritin-like metal-binding protein YciE [Rhizobium sp. BK512]
MSAVAGLKANLGEEKAMAEWLDAHVTQLTEKFLSLRMSGKNAKI